MKTESGFTLIEMIITLTVAAIVLAMAVPGFSNLIRTNRVAAQTNELVSALNLARSEAVTRSMNVSVCTSDTGNDCTNTNWEEGWIVFTDAGTAGTVDGADQVLKVFQAVNSIAITGSGFANANYLQYRATGRADSSGTFTICPDRSGVRGRKVNVSTTGRIKVQLGGSCP
ncbi:MAG: GspH/FimT family pseudopilin [Gammaproteobacteria bacterium]